MQSEHHLQAAISSQAAAATSSSNNVKQVYIPTPDASKVVPGFEKYYGKKFQEPTTYIKFSATVEDSVGVVYCMDEQDEAWLIKFNHSRRSKDGPCSEDQFELVMDTFENVVNENQPFLTTDVSQIMAFDDIEARLKSQHHPAVKLFGQAIYPHWKERRTARAGVQITPTLRVEEAEKDDADPYVCFRRREVRQVRKTRRSDQQSTEKLRQLRLDIYRLRDLVDMVTKREKLKLDQLQIDTKLFDHRSLVKRAKRQLKIPGDDEDLVAHHKKKRLSEIAPPQAARIPVRPDGKAEPIPLLPYSTYLKEREQTMLEHIEKRLAQHHIDSNLPWTDLTNNPYITLPKLYPNTFYRFVSASLPISSDSSSSDLPISHTEPASPVSSHTSTDSTPTERYASSFRQRIGRGGRIMLDRRRRPAKKSPRTSQSCKY